MATPTYIAVTEGAGKKLAADTYTENSQVVLDQKVILGENYIASYSANAGGVSCNVSAHLFQIMAGSSLNVRIRRVRIIQDGVAGAATYTRIYVVRLTSAGSGGSATTPAPMIGTDGASGATAMSGMTATGSTTTVVGRGGLGLVSAQPINLLNSWEWVADRMMEAILVPAGTSNGIALQINSFSTAAVSIDIDFSETSF